MSEVVRVRSNTSDCFQGVDGATSLKAEIVARLPVVNDAASYRNARRLLRDKLGGVEALREELAFAGFVDRSSGKLNVSGTPFNIFACVASGKTKQPLTEWEQAALGDFLHRFRVCCNRSESDLHWDSLDPRWVGRASMARRHRFLTTQDLHWQWFNALVFGLVPAEDGGCSTQRALEEVQAMEAAALQYTRTIGGWSDNIGLFVNVFGHNNVNSLFIHIVDLSETGPSLELLSYKNCPLSAVLRVLREEAAGTVAPPKPLHPVLAKLAEAKRPAQRALRGSKCMTKTAFQGRGGATSLKAELVEQVPELRDASGFRRARRLLQESLGGTGMVHEELLRAGFVDEDGPELTTLQQPANLFARIAAGAMSQPGMEEEQQALGCYQDRFVVCRNKPENDEHWDSEDIEWVGRASMSRHHRFLTTKDLHWQWFNVLVFGLVPPEEGGVGAQKALAVVEAMKAAALDYAAAIGGWSTNVGLFFHVFGHNSVNSLHLHIVDLDHVGPTFQKLAYKNCPLDAVARVLREEEMGLWRWPSSPSLLSGRPNGSGPQLPIPAFCASPCTAGGSPRAEAEQAWELLELNVGGKLLTVPRETLLQAPQGSLLHSAFATGPEAPAPVRDGEGRIFLNYPPKSFRRIVDHLRLLELAPLGQRLPPAAAPEGEEQELHTLAQLLGVEGLLGLRPATK